MWNNIVRLAIPEAIHKKQDQVFVWLMKQYELQPRSLWSVIRGCTQKDVYLPCTNFQKPTARGFPLKWGSKPKNKKIQETGIQHRRKVERMTNQDRTAGEQVWRFKNTPRTIWSRVSVMERDIFNKIHLLCVAYLSVLRRVKKQKLLVVTTIKLRK